MSDEPGALDEILNEEKSRKRVIAQAAFRIKQSQSGGGKMSRGPWKKKTEDLEPAGGQQDDLDLPKKRGPKPGSKRAYKKRGPKPAQDSSPSSDGDIAGMIESLKIKRDAIDQAIESLEAIL